MGKHVGRIFLVRHGETEYNAGGERMRGRSDVPLNVNGKKGAHATGKFLGDFNIARVIASDVNRTEQTAKIIANEINLANGLYVGYRVDAGLGPWDVGVLTGKPVDDAWKLVAKYERSPDMRVPDGETYRVWYERFRDALWKYIGWAQGGAGNTVLLSHARNLTAAPEIVKGRKSEPKALDWAHAPEPESVLEIIVSGDSITTKLIKGKYQDKTLRS